jgi:hypothetical protein
MATEATRLERARRRAQAQAQAWATVHSIVTDPVVLGVTMALGGMALSQRIRWAEDPLADESLRALATATCVLAGVSRAGLSGAAAAVLAGGAAIGSSAETTANLTGANGFVNFLLGSDRRLFGLPIPGVS